MEQNTAKELAGYIGQLVGEVIRLNIKITAAEEIFTERDPDLMRQYRTLVQKKIDSADAREADEALARFQERLTRF